MVSGDEIDAQIAREKAEEAAHIAQQTADLKETMGDLQQLVKRDQDKIERLDDQVAEAKETVSSATVHLVSAADQDLAARKKRCVCLSLVFMIILVTFLLWAKPWEWGRDSSDRRRLRQFDLLLD